MQVAIITGQTFCISWSPGALTSSCIKGPPILHMHFSPLLTFLFLFKTMLKCDFLHGAFLVSSGGFSLLAASKHVCVALRHSRQVGRGGHMGPMSGLTQEAPSPCLLKGSAQGPEAASLPLCPGAPGGWAWLLYPTLHWKLTRLDSGRWQESS